MIFKWPKLISYQLFSFFEWLINQIFAWKVVLWFIHILFFFYVFIALSCHFNNQENNSYQQNPTSNHQTVKHPTECRTLKSTSCAFWTPSRTLNAFLLPNVSTRRTKTPLLLKSESFRTTAWTLSTDEVLLAKTLILVLCGIERTLTCAILFHDERTFAETLKTFQREVFFAFTCLIDLRLVLSALAFLFIQNERIETLTC